METFSGAARLSHTKPLVSVILTTLAITSLTACAMFKKFDVRRIHQESATRQERNPVIFIPGFIGSKLRHRNTHETVWGRFMNAIKRGKTDDLSLPIDQTDLGENRDDLVPYALYESVAGVKFYGRLLEELVRSGGYRRGDINNPSPGDTCFTYIYDWRRDNVESAIGLGKAIRQLRARLGKPDMRFDIVAHSMGGLVAEYYLKYGMVDVLSDGRDHPVTYAGAADIGRLVLIGTPLRGTMSAFRVLNVGFSRTMSPEVLFTMPSVYQLLPVESYGHIVDPLGRPVNVDLHDASAWVENGWSVFSQYARDRHRRSDALHDAPTSITDEDLSRKRAFLQSALDRAVAFHKALERNTEEGSPVPVHIFGSDCIPTLDRAVLKWTPNGPLTLFEGETSPERTARELVDTIMVPGDGTVTAGSLLALESPVGLPRHDRRFASTFFFCESHGFLPANRGFQDNLLYVLFYGPSNGGNVTRAMGTK